MTEEQAIAVRDYYQGLLQDWELYIIFSNADNEPIGEEIPKPDSLYDVLCKRQGKIITVQEACEKFGFPQPYQIEGLV